MNTVKVEKKGTIKIIPKEYLGHYIMAGWKEYKAPTTTNYNEK